MLLLLLLLLLLLFFPLLFEQLMLEKVLVRVLPRLPLPLGVLEAVAALSPRDEPERLLRQLGRRVHDARLGAKLGQFPVGV